MRDLTDQRYGRLVALRRAPRHADTRSRWICQCDCGKTATVLQGSLTSGRTRSCGCLSQEVSRKMATERNPRRRPVPDRDLVLLAGLVGIEGTLIAGALALRTLIDRALAGAERAVR